MICPDCKQEMDEEDSYIEKRDTIEVEVICLNCYAQFEGTLFRPGYKSAEPHK